MICKLIMAEHQFIHFAYSFGTYIFPVILRGDLLHHFHTYPKRRQIQKPQGEVIKIYPILNLVVFNR